MLHFKLNETKGHLVSFSIEPTLLGADKVPAISFCYCTRINSSFIISLSSSVANTLHSIFKICLFSKSHCLYPNCNINSFYPTLAHNTINKDDFPSIPFSQQQYEELIIKIGNSFFQLYTQVILTDSHSNLVYLSYHTSRIIFSIEPFPMDQ